MAGFLKVKKWDYCFSPQCNIGIQQFFFLLLYLKENSVTPKVLFNGSKSMYVHIQRGLDIRVLDLLNFKPKCLSSH